MVAKEKEVELENVVAAGEGEVAGGVGREGGAAARYPKNGGGRRERKTIFARRREGRV